MMELIFGKVNRLQTVALVKINSFAYIPYIYIYIYIYIYFKYFVDFLYFQIYWRKRNSYLAKHAIKRLFTYMTYEV